MERDCNKKKTKKRESFEERSPLQHLNGLPIHRRNTKKSSHFSSSSAPAASRSLLSDNNTSSSSSLSSSSRTHTDKKPIRFLKIAKNEPKKSGVRRSNETPRKPFLQPSRKEKPRFITQRKNSQTDAKPICKNRQRSKLSSVQGKSERGSEKFQKRMKNKDDNGSGKCVFGLNRASNGSNSNFSENSTPVCGMVASGFGSISLNFCDHESALDDSVYEESNVDAAIYVKTPPVEASLSPEIQCQSHYRMQILRSVGTPVCYGAGHLVSGVSDRRKSKRRGSLKGGPEKGILFPDARTDDNVSVDLQKSSIPLLAEAEVRWHLSPRDLELEDFGNRLDQDRIVCDDDSDTLDSLSLPSMLCGNTMDFSCGKSDFSGSGGVRNVAIDRRNSDAIFLPSKAAEFTRILEPLSYNMDESLSGNIIQTPDSDSSSDACFGRSRLEVHLSNSVWPELGSMTGTLERVKLSPRSEVSMCDAPCLGSHSADMGSSPISLDSKNVGSVSSRVSDDNLTLSQMRISWCEGLASQVIGTDESDCCCCLSDEEINGNESERSNNSGRMVAALVENKDDGFRKGRELCPVLLDYEPCLRAEGKVKSFSLKASACAESICTDGGGLLASDDSDWTYFQENHSFHVA